MDGDQLLSLPNPPCHGAHHTQTLLRQRRRHQSLVEGAQIVADKATRAVLPDQDVVTVTLRPGDNALLVKIVNGGGIGGFYFNSLDKRLPDNILTLLKIRPESRTADAAKQVRDYFLANSPSVGLTAIREQVQTLAKQRDALLDGPAARHGHVRRPAAADAHSESRQLPDAGCGDQTRPASCPRSAGRTEKPSWLRPLARRRREPADCSRAGQPHLAIVLRSRACEDVGESGDAGELPSQPELLDWLAVEFRESGWNVKRSSDSSSRAPPIAKAPRSPRNASLSATRRTNCSRSSGSLSAALASPARPRPRQQRPARRARRRQAGLPVSAEGYLGRPGNHQGTRLYLPAIDGADLFRRSLYTFWRRTVASGNMFDASSRQRAGCPAVHYVHAVARSDDAE